MFADASTTFTVASRGSATVGAVTLPTLPIVRAPAPPILIVESVVAPAADRPVRAVKALLLLTVTSKVSVPGTVMLASLPAAT